MAARELLNKNSFPWRVLLAAIFVCGGGSFHFGYQATVVNPTEPMFRDFLNQSHHLHYGRYIESEQTYRILWAIVLNAQTMGGLLGAPILGKLADRLGRRKTFFVSVIFTMCGLLCQSLSKMAFSYELFAIGRFVCAVGTNISLLLEDMYLSEISPAALRGFFTSIMGIMLEFGFITGGIMGLSSILGNDTAWPWLFVIEMAPVIALVIALPFLHESPRVLFSRGKIDECKKSLRFFNHQNIDADLREIEEAEKNERGPLGFKELWTKKHLRRAVFLCLLASLVANQSGITYIELLSTNILEQIGLPMSVAQYSTLIIFAPSFVAAFFGSCLVEKAGRRSLILWTTAVLILTNAAIMAFAMVYEKHRVEWAGYASIASCTVYNLALGIGPVLLQWTILSEMMPQNAKSTAQSTVLMAEKICAVIEGFAFFPMQGILGPYVFLFYIVLASLILAIFIPLLPETKKKSAGNIMKSLGHDGEEITRRDANNR